jgi:hypothetical protein
VLVFLDRSVYELTAKARAHCQQSVHFRSSLMITDWLSSNDLAMMENRAAQLLETLLLEQLLNEALRLIKSIFPAISQFTRDQLEKIVVLKLRSGI